MYKKSDNFSVSVTKNFEKAWISKHTKKLGGVDPDILEQCVYALALLTYLAETELDFVFKGGTCLLLRLKQINRLSIDIDITTNKSIGKLKPTLERIANAKGFNGYKERDTRSSNNLPIRYFDFSYTSTLTGAERLVSLDILRERNVFKEGTMVPVETSFFKPSKQRLVFVPSIEELLADKLTAFAPHTVGLLYKEHQDESMPIIKQLFDVGLLFESAKKTATIREMYRQMVNLQNKYFKTKHSVTRATEDTIDAALAVSKLDLDGVSDTLEM